jgi:UDP-N-acetylmuramoylalanine--D-glutamate ligase
LILIAGGDGKGADFSALRESVSRFVKTLIVLGADAPALQAALGDCVPTTKVADMTAAVRVAHDQAEPGDVVLLSPACASLDMYPGFAARGEDFADKVAQVVA